MFKVLGILIQRDFVEPRYNQPGVDHSQHPRHASISEVGSAMSDYVMWCLMFNVIGIWLQTLFLNRDATNWG